MSLHLQALRSGNYLKFLQWPKAILESQTGQKVDADMTIDLLVAQWLQNGFCDADIKQVVLLYAYSELPSEPLKGSLSYAFTTIYMALTQCIGTRQLDLEKMKAEVTKEELEKLNQSLMPMLCRLYKTDEYLTALSTSVDEQDKLKETRLSVVRSLYTHLCAESEYNEELQATINEHVQKLRTMNPADSEKTYLDYLEKPPVNNRFYQLMATLGEAFFNADPKNGDPTLRRPPQNPLSYFQ